MLHMRTTCRSCSQDGLRAVLLLGSVPLVDRLLTDSMLEESEPMYPLTVCFCPRCSLTQLAETVPPEEMYDEHYRYYSSFSDALLRHSRENAERLIQTCRLDPTSLVVELASNDGYMLKNFLAHGIPVLGIDPCEGPAQAAEDAGVRTVREFFGADLARRLRDDGHRADVLIANNVLAHVPDLNGFVEGIGILLADSGVAVIEVPYVKDLVDHCEFDTIYHEHLCYFSVTALDHLFARHGLCLNDVEQLAIHGGSLRLYVERRPERAEVVSGFLDEEARIGLNRFGYYQDFGRRVQAIRESLLGLLRDLKREGKRVAAYGAAAKGSTMINYVGIGTDLVEYVVDRNTHKQGCYMPGKHLPIRPPERLLEDMPDYVLLLAWNFADEIMRQQSEYLGRGGAFIVPVPTVRVMNGSDVLVQRVGHG